MAAIETLAETGRGKKVDLHYDPKKHLYTIKFNPGGELPKELMGHWTNKKFAKLAVDAYINKKTTGKDKPKPQNWVKEQPSG